ncbi:MAG: CHAT domain-containing protein [Coleofasciculaceae cyanobacterium]
MAVPVAARNLPTLESNSQAIRLIDAPTLLAQGQTYYDAGLLTEAASTWQQAAKLYKQVGDSLHQALSLNYLSLAYQDLGRWEEAEVAIAQSLNLLQTQDNAATLAQVLNTQGSLQLATGKGEAALKTWQEAELAYAQVGDEMGVLGSKINQAQAWQSLGMFRRSQNLLAKVEQELKTKPNSHLKATGLRSLGLVWQAVGDLKASEHILEESLTVAQNLNSPDDASAALFGLGNTARGLGDIENALDYYQKAAAISESPLNKIEAQLNQLKLLVDYQYFTKAEKLLPAIESNLAQLPPSRDAIYAQVNLTESLIELLESQNLTLQQKKQLPDQPQIAQILTQAFQAAKTLNDPRAESLALGTLGKLYEQNSQWSDAQTLTQQALILSNSINAADISYQLQWQIARILTQKGEIEGAIAANQQAFELLQSLRGNLVAMNQDVRFSFQEQIEPIYRHLVSILLHSPSQDNLKRARKVIESLQLAELENFFRTPCLNVKAEQIDTVIEKNDQAAAVIYPIILPDRLAIILSLPGQPLTQYSTKLPQEEIEKTISSFRQTMALSFPQNRIFQLSETVYDWLIRPLEEQLSRNNIKTLVFVLDGVLRNAPMAALYDGKQYLIEKYSIALTPSLQLLEPRSLKQVQLQSLIGGLSKARSGFSPLPSVAQEIKQISSKIPSQVLLNEQFTRAALEDQINNSSVAVVHLATHGRFSSNPEDTFLLAWDERLNVNTLSQLLKTREQTNKQPIEFLVLSSCQTATGDKRAALGLAGLAVRSGVRSTIATLWYVDDQSTAEIMVKLYHNLLQTDSNRAEALRQAQLSLLKQEKYQHPYYWASIVLIGNWL